MESKELIQALREDAEWAYANELETPVTIIIEYRESKDKPETGNPVTDKPHRFTDEEARDLFGKENAEGRA